MIAFRGSMVAKRTALQVCILGGEMDLIEDDFIYIVNNFF